MRRTAQESVAADTAAHAAKANDSVPGENGGDFRATLPAARTEAAAAPAGGPAPAAVRTEPRLLAATWSHINPDRSKQPRGGPKTQEERLKAIEDAKAALRSRVALRKASQSEQASLQEFVNQQGTTSRRPVSLGRSELGSSSPISSSFSGSASAIGSRSSRGGDLDISVGACGGGGGGGQSPTFAVTHPAYGEQPEQQQQQQQQQPAASDAGGVKPSGGLAGVYDDDDDDEGTAPASSGGAEAADQGLGSSDGASGCAAGPSGGNAAVEAAAAAAMALEAGDMTLSGGGAVALASPGKDRGVSDGEAPGGLLMTGRRGRVHLSGSYTEAAAAAVAGAAAAAAAAAAAKSSSSSMSPTNKSSFGTPPRVTRSGSASEGRSLHSPPPGPLLVHPQRRQAARQNRSGLRINTSSSGEESAGEKAGRQQQQQQQQAFDRSQLPRSPTAESRKLSKEAAESRAGGGWVQVELPPGAIPAAAAAAAPAGAPAGSGGKQNAEHARSGGGGGGGSSDFAWSKVGAFPFGQGDMPPTPSKPMSPLVQPRTASSFPVGNPGCGGVGFRAIADGEGGAGGGSTAVGAAGASSLSGGGSIADIGGDLGDGNAPVSPIVRMPAEEFSARSLGGMFGAKSQEEVEAEEVWHRGSTALMREDTISPPAHSSSPQPAAAATASGEATGRSGDGDCGVPSTARPSTLAPPGGAATEAASGPPSSRAAASGDGGFSSVKAASKDVGDSLSGTGGSERARPGNQKWREIRDKALAANGGSFTTARRLANSRASPKPKLEFKRSALPTLGQLRRNSVSPTPSSLAGGVRKGGIIRKSKSDCSGDDGGGGSSSGSSSVVVVVVPSDPSGPPRRRRSACRPRGGRWPRRRLSRPGRSPRETWRPSARRRRRGPRRLPLQTRRSWRRRWRGERLPNRPARTHRLLRRPLYRPSASKPPHPRLATSSTTRMAVLLRCRRRPQTQTQTPPAYRRSLSARPRTR
ncbi:unnamed protein product [Ectocarpus sp. 12 AP-2014]